MNTIRLFILDMTYKHSGWYGYVNWNEYRIPEEVRGLRKIRFTRREKRFYDVESEVPNLLIVKFKHGEWKDADGAVSQWERKEKSILLVGEDKIVGELDVYITGSPEVQVSMPSDNVPNKHWDLDALYNYRYEKQVIAGIDEIINAIGGEVKELFSRFLPSYNERTKHNAYDIALMKLKNHLWDRLAHRIKLPKYP